MGFGTAARVYEFGDYRLDTAAQVLTRLDGQEIPLTRRGFDTLRTLVEHAGELLDRPTLMQAVWPNLVVEDNNLDQQISLIRHALGERRGEHRYVVTVPGRGYRFAAAVATLPAGAGPRAQRAPAGVAQSSAEPSARSTDAPSARPAFRARRRWVVAGAAALALLAGAAAVRLGGVASNPDERATAARPTLAVLPFKPMTAADRNESLELGMAETLIVGLNGDRLRVSPLSSVRRYAGAEQDALAAGRELGVAVVLEGYIQHAGEALRVSARLLNVADGGQLWSQRYDERFSDILTVQDSIAARVLGALTPSLASLTTPLRRYTDDPKAYELYLDGQFYRRRLGESDLQTALGRFLAAIERDPNFALAYVGAAECYEILAVFSIETPHDTFPLAKQAVDKALELAPDLGEAYAALGHLKAQYDLDWQGAERDYRRAIELNPYYAPAQQWLGHLFGYAGRFDEALAQLRMAQALEPAAPVYSAITGMILSYQGRYDEAIQQLQRTLAMAPDLVTAHTYLTMAYLRRGDLELAAEHAERIQSSAPGSFGYVGQIHALAGRRGEALAEIERLIALSQHRYVPAYEIASIYATLGEVDQAFAWLERAFEERGQLVGWLPWDAAFDSVRSDPRYADLVSRLPVASR
jgi:DNA-binding winged helix-turn-helix (wHTH) protein/TolB-like protein